MKMRFVLEVNFLNYVLCRHYTAHVYNSQRCDLDVSDLLSRCSGYERSSYNNIKQKVIDFLNTYFVTGEPMSEAIGLCDEGYR